MGVDPKTGVIPRKAQNGVMSGIGGLQWSPMSDAALYRLHFL